MDMMIFAEQPFGDQDSMKDFLFANSQSHSLIAMEFEKSGKAMSSQPLGEMKNMEDWLLIHADIHDEEIAILGIRDTGIDLSSVDLQDESQYRDWMWQHALIHKYINDTLGLV